MSALRSLRVSRTLLTSARWQTASVTPTAHLYRPLLTPRFFSNTAKMTTEEKKGVHNLMKKSEFDDAMAVKDSLMVVDCFATWCGPCKVIAPKVVQFSEKYPNARFFKLDVDEVSDVAQELGIRAMPTFLFFKNGEKVSEVVGANPKALEAAIEANIGAEA